MPNSWETFFQLVSHGYYCVVSRHEFIWLPFQRSASGLECQPLLLEQLRSSCLFLFQHSAQSGETGFFQIFFFLKRWFVVTLGSPRGPVEDEQVL
jgi:hypothetical protein